MPCPEEQGAAEPPPSGAALTYLDNIYGVFSGRTIGAKGIDDTAFCRFYPPPRTGEKLQKIPIRLTCRVERAYNQVATQSHTPSTHRIRDRGIILHHHNTTHLAVGQDQNLAKSDIMRTARVKMEYRLAAEKYLAPLLPDASADKLLHCGNYVVTQATADRQRERIEIGYYCGQRLCPSCAWRQSVHDAQRLAAISAAAADRHNLRMVLVTLTVPNVSSDDLRSTLRDLNKSYNKLRKRAKMAVLLAHTAKKLEITYNRTMETYHPHLHIICYVPSTYWARSNYVSHDTLLDEWRAATGCRQITQVDIRVCRSTDTSDAIREVAKYAAKAADYTASAEVMRTMYHALYGAQRLSLAGIARELSAAYDRHELDQYIARDDTQYTLRIVYQWLAGDYAEIGSSTIDQQSEQLARDGWHELVPEDWGVLMGED